MKHIDVIQEKAMAKCGLQTNTINLFMYSPTRIKEYEMNQFEITQGYLASLIII